MHKPDLAEITSKPASYFSSPTDIVESKELEPGSKIIALKAWEFEVRQLEVATEENMVASATTSLQDIHDAMRVLGHEPGEDAGSGCKAG